MRLSWWDFGDPGNDFLIDVVAWVECLDRVKQLLAGEHIRVDPLLGLARSSQALINVRNRDVPLRDKATLLENGNIFVRLVLLYRVLRLVLLEEVDKIALMRLQSDLVGKVGDTKLFDDF